MCIETSSGRKIDFSIENPEEMYNLSENDDEKFIAKKDNNYELKYFNKDGTTNSLCFSFDAEDNITFLEYDGKSYSIDYGRNIIRLKTENTKESLAFPPFGENKGQIIYKKFFVDKDDKVITSMQIVSFKYRIVEEKGKYSIPHIYSYRLTNPELIGFEEGFKKGSSFVAFQLMETNYGTYKYKRIYPGNQFTSMLRNIMDYKFSNKIFSHEDIECVGKSYGFDNIQISQEMIDIFNNDALLLDCAEREYKRFKDIKKALASTGIGNQKVLKR